MSDSKLILEPFDKYPDGLEDFVSSPENDDAFAMYEDLIRFMRKRQDPTIMVDKLRKHFGSAANAMRADALVFQDLGMHPTDAMLMGRLVELTRFVNRTSYGKSPKLARLVDATPYLIANFFGLQEEHFYLFCLNHHGKLKKRVLLQEGTEYGAIFDMRKIMLETLRAEPYAIFISHNHPGGTLVPSRNDIECTFAAIKNMGALGIPMVDHLIVAGNNVVSMRDNGFVSEKRWLAQAPRNHLLRNWLLPYDDPKTKQAPAKNGKRNK